MHRIDRIARAVALAAFVFTPGAALAQVNPDIQLGSRIPVAPAKKDPVLDGAIRDQYVRCTYPSLKDKVDVLLRNSDPVTVDLEAAGIDTRLNFRDHQLRNCFVLEGDLVQASIAFTPHAFRYMMLEGAYRRAIDELTDGHLAKVAAPRKYVTSGGALPTAKSLGTFSDCIAAQDPRGADRLLRTGSGTEAERAAATAMVPALSACIVEGQQLQLTMINIRSFAADGMWQRFVADGSESK